MAGESSLTIDTEMRLGERVALAWRILRHRRVTFTVRSATPVRSSEANVIESLSRIADDLVDNCHCPHCASASADIYDAINPPGPLRRRQR